MLHDSWLPALVKCSQNVFRWPCYGISSAGWLGKQRIYICIHISTNCIVAVHVVVNSAMILLEKESYLPKRLPRGPCYPIRISCNRSVKLMLHIAILGIPNPLFQMTLQTAHVGC